VTDLAVALTAVERSRLSELEAVVERGRQVFVEVGNALMEIRDERLYRLSHGTFEEYCRERWGFVASRARQLIAAAESVTVVTAAGLPAPANERQARELVPLLADEDELLRIYRGLRERYGDRLTAGIIKRTVLGAAERQLERLFNPEPRPARSTPRRLPPSPRPEFERLRPLARTFQEQERMLWGNGDDICRAAQDLLAGEGPGPLTPARIERHAARLLRLAAAMRAAGASDEAAWNFAGHARANGNGRTRPPGRSGDTGPASAAKQQGEA
jgi:hypothetical protein